MFTSYLPELTSIIVTTIFSCLFLDFTQQKRLRASGKSQVSESKYSVQDVDNWKYVETSLMITDKIPLFNGFRTARTRDTTSDSYHATVIDTHTNRRYFL